METRDSLQSCKDRCQKQSTVDSPGQGNTKQFSLHLCMLYLLQVANRNEGDGINGNDVGNNNIGEDDNGNFVGNSNIGNSQNGNDVGNDNRDRPGPDDVDEDVPLSAAGGYSTINDDVLFNPRYENSFDGNDNF